MNTYKIQIVVHSKTHPDDWHFGEVLVIDEPYEIVSTTKEEG